MRKRIVQVIGYDLIDYALMTWVFTFCVMALMPDAVVGTIKLAKFSRSIYAAISILIICLVVRKRRARQ